jgi:DNA invertase Pin-like site-specific DNA recombinase
MPYRGRVPTAKRKADAVRKLLDDGLNAAEVARRLYISRASVYRIRAMGRRRQIELRLAELLRHSNPED